MNNNHSRLLEREDHLSDFDRCFKRARIFGIIYMLITGAVGIGILGFVAWASIKLMAHYGVI